MNCGDFSGGPRVKNQPANAGDMGWISGPGRFYMPQGLCTSTTEPALRNKRNHCNEKPRLATARESLSTTMKSQHSQAKVKRSEGGTPNQRDLRGSGGQGRLPARGGFWTVS